MPYLSYPSGAVIPVFLISEIMNHAPSVGLVMSYDLVNGFLVTLFLSLTVFFFLRRLQLRANHAFLFALIPILLELFLPEPFYYFQNSFFTDQAVILPFVLVVFLEVVREGRRGRFRSIVDLLQALVFFYGTFTDWFFVFIAFIFYLDRLFFGEIRFRPRKDFFKDSLKFATPPLAAIFVFLIQVTAMMWGDLENAAEWIKHKYVVRSGLNGSTSELGAGSGGYLHHIARWAKEGYGLFGLAVIAITVLFSIGIYFFVNWRKRQKRAVAPAIQSIARLSFIITVPCILQILAFLNHSAVHSFSVLKLSVPFATVPFVLIPVSLVMAVRSKKEAGSFKYMFTAIIGAFILAGFSIAQASPEYDHFFNPKNTFWYHVADVTNKHTVADDVVFSPDMEVPYHPPQPVSLTMKKVYRVKTVSDVAQEIQNAHGSYRVVIIFWNKPGKGSYWGKAVSAADSTLDDGAFYCYYSAAAIKKLESEYNGGPSLGTGAQA